MRRFLVIPMLCVAAIYAAAAPVTVDTAHSSAAELATKAELEKLLAANDLDRWTFTHRVVIDEKSIPHSHPVLTIHTRHLGHDDELLSTYVHEQLHWYLVAHDADTQHAIAELKQIYKNVPVGYPDGADDENSTYLHLLVCYDEEQADRALMGPARTRTVMEYWAGDHYRWVYRTLLQEEDRIAKVVGRNRLLPPEPANDRAKNLDHQGKAK